MSKVAFIIPCRNKAAYDVEGTIKSVLSQTYTPMEIVISDQGSTDATPQIIERLVAEYKGPNAVTVLQCPHTEYKGMAGFNAHINWIHDQVDADIFIFTSADDINHFERATKVMEAFEAHPEADYVGTCVQYTNPDGTIVGVTGFPWLESRFITPDEVVDKRVGGSASGAWKRTFYERHRLENHESPDVVLPFMASLEGGFYFIADPLYAYIYHADPENTGMEGRIKAARNIEESMQANELNNYHIASNWFSVLRRLKKGGYELSETLDVAIMRKVIECSHGWAALRDTMTMNRIRPLAMEV